MSPAVLAAMGSVMTNKYAEGYPAKRYYGGCEFVDVAEELARARAKQLFGCDHVNVQPHSGAQANMAVYLATLPARRHGARHGPLPRRPPHPRPPAQLLGQDVPDRPLLVRQDTETHRLRRAARAGPGAQAEADRLRRLGLPADHRLRGHRRRSPTRSGALVMADIAHIAGLVAVGLHPSPVPTLRVRHHHHAQDAARPARRHDHVQGSSSPRRSTRRSSPASRAARSCTSSPPRRWRSPRRSRPTYKRLHRAGAAQRQGAVRRAAGARLDAWSPAAPTTTSC